MNQMLLCCASESLAATALVCGGTVDVAMFPDPEGRVDTTRFIFAPVILESRNTQNQSESHIIPQAVMNLPGFSLVCMSQYAGIPIQICRVNCSSGQLTTAFYP